MTAAQFLEAFHALAERGLPRPLGGSRIVSYDTPTNTAVHACIVAEHLRRLGEKAHMWVVPPTQYGGLAEVWRCTDPDGDSILLQTAESTRAALIALGEILVKESPDA